MGFFRESFLHKEKLTISECVKHKLGKILFKIRKVVYGPFPYHKLYRIREKRTIVITTVINFKQKLAFIDSIIL